MLCYMYTHNYSTRMRTSFIIAESTCPLVQWLPHSSMEIVNNMYIVFTCDPGFRFPTGKKQEVIECTRTDIEAGRGMLKCLGMSYDHNIQGNFPCVSVGSTASHFISLSLLTTTKHATSDNSW